MAKKLLLILSGCFLLAACGKETALEEMSTETISTEVMEDESKKALDENVEATMQDVTIQDAIMSGDFSCIEDSYRERVQNNYERRHDAYEWRRLDLNHDGIEDLILQEKETVTEDSNQHRILGIFACGETQAKCVLWDDVGMGYYAFCGVTGELMERYYSFGTMVDVEGFKHYFYDAEWNKVVDYSLVIWKVDGPDGYDYPAEWFEAHPDMQEEGIYYRKYEGADTGKAEAGEALTLEELKEVYRTEMGMEIEMEW